MRMNISSTLLRMWDFSLRLFLRKFNLIILINVFWILVELYITKFF
ncbi:unnamed protein product [Spirodela intermedia]|uniref:Uncharacterized protein n=2 Tax=Spirodela intermedia TaxID=51605 RepID=A0A7I8L1Z7_SPIIN|nr:unnamed protein product [Spirodela intermedia]CAA6666442.1 unnamed protein product [Spirodela intermedia]CAA7403234.1 unnamed protein product [Spirodela intermedia]